MPHNEGEDEEAVAAAAAAAQFENLRRFVDATSLKSEACHLKPLTSRTTPIRVVLGRESYQPDGSFPDTTNDAFNKLAMVLHYLCNDVERLRQHAEQRVYPLLLMFGQGFSATPEPTAALVSALPGLLDAVQLAEALRPLAINLVSQLGSMCAEHTRKATILQGETAYTAFMAASEALGILFRLDSLVHHDGVLKSAFAAMRRLISVQDFVPDSSDSFSGLRVTSLLDDINALERALLVDGGCQLFLKRQLGKPTVRQLFGGDTAAAAAFPTAVRILTEGILGRMIGGTAHTRDLPKLTGLVVLASAHAWFCSHSGSIDRSLLRMLQDLHLKVPVLMIWGHASVPTAAALLQLLPPAVYARLPVDHFQGAHLELHRVAEDGSDHSRADLRRFTMAAMAWSCDMDATFAPSSDRRPIAKITEHGEATLLNGIRIATSLRQHAQLPALLAVHMQQPLQGREAVHLGRAVTLLKSMEATFDRWAESICLTLPHIISATRVRLSNLVRKVATASQAGSHSTEASNVLRALTGTSQRQAKGEDVTIIAAIMTAVVSKGPVTPSQLLQLRLCIDSMRATGAVSISRLTRLAAEVATLEELTMVQETICEECCCDWLWGCQQALPPALAAFAKEAGGAGRVSGLLAAFADAATLLPHCSPATDSNLQAYDDHLFEALQTNVLEAAAVAIDTELRLRAFAIGEMTESAGSGAEDAAAAAASASSIAASASEESRWVLPFVSIPPLQLVTSVVSVRQWLGDRMSATLHENAAVAPQNSRRLREVAAMAQEGYRLPVRLPRLPAIGDMGGLDVLEVMGNLDVFSACFSYSCTTQSFVQRAGAASHNSPYLSVLTVENLTVAARAHGLALVQALAKAAYKSLSSRISSLSQVLFDETVRGRLLMEARWWASERSALKSLYPPQRAARLARNIADSTIPSPVRTETAEAGAYVSQSHLERLRLIITECGNVLGLLRVARQAGLQVSTQAAQWASPPPQLPPVNRSTVSGPEPEVPRSMAETAEAEGLRPSGCGTAAVLDDTFDLMHSCSADGLQLFQQMLPIFTKELCTPTNRHLRTFHMAVPALVAAAVEEALVEKEALSHRRRSDVAAGFANDGFPLGLVFVLKILEQETAFDGLQWFQSVANDYAAEASQVQAQAPSRRLPSQGSSSITTRIASRFLDALQGGSSAAGAAAGVSPAEEENRQLLMGRIRNYSAEYEQLSNSIAGFRMFFADIE